MGSIVPFLWCQRRLRTLLGSSRRGVGRAPQDLVQDDLRVVPVLNALFTIQLLLEARVIARRRHLPIGASLVAVARRPLNR